MARTNAQEHAAAPGGSPAKSEETQEERGRETKPAHSPHRKKKPRQAITGDQNRYRKIDRGGWGEGGQGGTRGTLQKGNMGVMRATGQSPRA